MLKTRSLVTESENEEVWVGIRKGDKVESINLEFPTIHVEASDASDDHDDEGDPEIRVRFVDGRLHGFAFSLDMENARTLATMLLSIVADYEVKAVEPPKDKPSLRVLDF